MSAAGERIGRVVGARGAGVPGEVGGQAMIRWVKETEYSSGEAPRFVDLRTASIPSEAVVATLSLEPVIVIAEKAAELGISVGPTYTIESELQGQIYVFSGVPAEQLPNGDFALLLDRADLVLKRQK